MSHSICPDCGERYRDEHECPKDGQAMLDRIAALEELLRDAQDRIIELGSRVSRLESQAGGDPK